MATQSQGRNRSDSIVSDSDYALITGGGRTTVTVTVTNGRVMVKKTRYLAIRDKNYKIVANASVCPPKMAIFAFDEARCIFLKGQIQRLEVTRGFWPLSSEENMRALALTYAHKDLFYPVELKNVEFTEDIFGNVTARVPEGSNPGFPREYLAVHVGESKRHLIKGTRAIGKYHVSLNPRDQVGVYGVISYVHDDDLKRDEFKVLSTASNQGALSDEVTSGVHIKIINATINGPNSEAIGNILVGDNTIYITEETNIAAPWIAKDWATYLVEEADCFVDGGSIITMVASGLVAPSKNSTQAKAARCELDWGGAETGKVYIIAVKNIRMIGGEIVFGVIVENKDLCPMTNSLICKMRVSDYSINCEDGSDYVLWFTVRRGTWGVSYFLVSRAEKCDSIEDAIAMTIETAATAAAEAEAAVAAAVAAEAIETAATAEAAVAVAVAVAAEETETEAEAEAAAAAEATGGEVTNADVAVEGATTTMV